MISAATAGISSPVRFSIPKYSAMPPVRRRLAAEVSVPHADMQTLPSAAATDAAAGGEAQVEEDATQGLVDVVTMTRKQIFNAVRAAVGMLHHQSQANVYSIESGFAP